jgi:glycosyltransferase involved in cell wall biosynthesis
MENPQLAKDMGKKGLERIQQNFNIAKMTESYIELYDKCNRKSRKTVV